MFPCLTLLCIALLCFLLFFILSDSGQAGWGRARGPARACPCRPLGWWGCCCIVCTAMCCSYRQGEGQIILVGGGGGGGGDRPWHSAHAETQWVHLVYNTIHTAKGSACSTATGQECKQSISELQALHVSSCWCKTSKSDTQHKHCARKSG